MGSYGTISFNGVGIYGAKNAINFHMLSLFSPSDYIMETKLYDDDYTLVEKKFITSCDIAKKRLDIIGYTVDMVEKEFYENMDILKNSDDDYPPELYEILSRFYDFTEDCPNYKLIEEMNLENFKQSIKSFFQMPIAKIPTDSILLDYIIDHRKMYYGVGLPVLDPLSEVRIILETLGENDSVEYEISEIIDNGYVEIEGVFAYWKDGPFNLISNETVILAEGTTDIFVLKKSLNLLFPQFSHLYKFFDFDNLKSPGSTSNLVNLIKGFVNSGIKSRIIALFDNDTAAFEALSTIELDKLTPNIKIVHLPHLDWATVYPTLGPTGESNTDINKLACSMELFMGKNLLKKDGKFIPIQWTGYNPKLNRYQGEILYKKEINENFRSIIKKAEEDGLENVSHDWDDLKYLWQTIFTAYNF